MSTLLALIKHLRRRKCNVQLSAMSYLTEEAFPQVYQYVDTRIARQREDGQGNQTPPYFDTTPRPLSPSIAPGR